MPFIPKITLKAGGERTLVKVEEAEAMQKRFREEMRWAGSRAVCHTLDLSCRAWRVESLQKLQPMLDQVALTVKYLKMDDVIASLETDVGLATLSYLAQVFGAAPGVTRVNLNDNALGSRGIECLEPLLTNPNVTNWSFVNTGIAEADGAILHQRFVHTDAATGHRTCRIEYLDTGRNRMGIGGARHIGALLSACPGLVSFSHAGSSPQAGSDGLCRGLASLSAACGTTQGTSLQVLDLTDLSLDDNMVTDICTVLANSPKLHVLKLRDSGLALDGLQRVIAALHTTRVGLTTLDLGSLDSVGAEGGALVADYVESSPTRHSLQHWSMDLNELGNEGVCAVAAAASQCTALVTLQLDDNDVSRLGGWYLLHNVCATLHTLELRDNTELPASVARQLQALYPTVHVDEDLEDDDDNDEEDDNVDAMAAGMQATHL